MIQTLSHPAQSAEFLSRLHDGELPPAEAAAFDSHRRECEECRAAVAQYEAALAAYRASPVPPHASDLSARILRNIRKASPSRRPFGVMFGIDIRWAGALAAALLVVIIGAPVFSRRQSAQPVAVSAPPATSEAPIPAYVLDAEDVPAPETKTKADAAPQSRLRAAPKTEAAAPARDNAAGFAAAPPSAGERMKAAEPQVQRDEPVAGTDALSTSVPAAPEPAAPSFHAQAPAVGKKELRESRETTSALADRRQSASAPVGGEAGGGAEESVAPIKLVIHPFDGGGQPPDLARTPTDERLAVLRGRTFVLLVESGGRVRSVEERADRKLSKDRANETDDSVAARARVRAAAEAILGEIVFQPADRSRRLIVTVQ